MKIIAIKEMSAGNESVGDMWTETKIFNETDTLADVMEFINNSTRENITLSIAVEDKTNEK
jgi:hypothetical protein